MHGIRTRVVVGGFIDEVAASSWSAAEVAAASAASFIAFSSSSFWTIASKRSRHSFEWQAHVMYRFGRSRGMRSRGGLGR